MLAHERLVVLGINKTVTFYHGNPKTGKLQPVTAPDPADLELEQDATAVFQTADDLYTHERYRVQSGGLDAANRTTDPAAPGP